MSASEDARGIKSAATVEELVAATKDTGVRRIAVRGDLAHAPSIRLSPRQSLHGEGDGARITFAAKADGRAYEVRNRMTLCRCGRSENKPFCNGAHAADPKFRDGPR